jgi:hypothetical protein
MDPNQWNTTVAANIKNLTDEASRNQAYEVKIKEFDNGNAYYMLISETFTDVRLVFAPPSFIGKYGGDLDNWVWPRHTGDFSVFRIYANPSNQPAKFNQENIPYHPAHYLPISLKPKKEGDFTLIFGFPGSTSQHASSTEMEYIMQKERPMAINMRAHTLAILEAAMKANDTIRIQYASKQSRISNAYKKWIGQVDGLKKTNALEIKKKEEETYIKLANSKSEWEMYGNTLTALKKEFSNAEDNLFAYSTLIEYGYYGAEIFKLARMLSSYINAYPNWKKEGIWEQKKQEILSSIKHFFGEYNPKVDQTIFEQLTPLLKKYLDNKYLYIAQSLNDKTTEQISQLIYEKSILCQSKKMTTFIENMNEKSILKLEKDPAYKLFLELESIITDLLSPQLKSFYAVNKIFNRYYIEGKNTMFPGKNHWCDANFTMRVSYGQIEGTAPQDGVLYTNHTTIDGIWNKYLTGKEDYAITQRFIDLYQKKDFGRYAQEGELWICFLGSNHTTGGNSGSPVIDEEGNLIGLNFDRTWESTMSDYYFDKNICRNIMVDIRYVLWVIEKYSGATRLINELNLVNVPNIQIKKSMQIYLPQSK